MKLKIEVEVKERSDFGVSLDVIKEAIERGNNSGFDGSIDGSAGREYNFDIELTHDEITREMEEG